MIFQTAPASCEAEPWSKASLGVSLMIVMGEMPYSNSSEK